MRVEAEIRHQALQPRVLFLDLPESPEVTDAQMRILLLSRIERRLADAHLPTDIPTAVPHSAWRNAYATCASENLERFIGPILSSLGTPQSATVLQF